MHLPSIRMLVEKNEIKDLEQAETAILEGKKPSIEVPGADEGEQLTHVLAAIWIKKEMESKGIPLQDAIRAYTARVRTSIN
ncbi:MAG: hypothetical protein RML72_10145, partial [Bacteroidia bacterium]|nr:hypothetical protein [Bacteroidia bacterium]MDW8159218.1 hypothetical protein [Bacteroidia bacterium]